MNNFKAIKQMNEDELAFLLAAIELGDPNRTPTIKYEDLNFYKEYLNKDDGEGVLEAIRYFLEYIK